MNAHSEICLNQPQFEINSRHFKNGHLVKITMKALKVEPIRQFSGP